MNQNERPSPSGAFGKWNRKIHTYLGLYLLLFLWLFSVTGLVMNHPKWFPYKVERAPVETQVTPPSGTNDLANAKLLRDELGLRGEILLRRQRNEGKLNFMILRPNKRFAVNVDRETGAAKVNHVTPNKSVTLGDLHTFSGVRGMWNEPAQERDWIVTRVWSLSMDAVCVGVIYLVLSSLYMAFQLKGQRLFVVSTLTIGTLTCAFFVWGLTMLS